MRGSIVADGGARIGAVGATLQKRSLIGACLAHVLHDGYTDLIYVLLPVWQREFALSYAGLALVRCLFYGTMGGLQIPVDRAARRVGARVVLGAATVVAACGFLLMSVPGGLLTLGAGLVLAGIGSSAQHPRASIVVTQAYGAASRRPLGLYNFAGDLGKSAFPPLVTALLLVMTWRPAVAVVAIIGLVAAVCLVRVLPPAAAVAASSCAAAPGSGGGRGFRLLLVIGVLDTATRMGFLLFLPFLLHAKGGGETAIGWGFAMLFGGGAFGKAACGWLGERLGIAAAVIGTETATSVLIAATLLLPLGPALALLPLLGIVLNGTSSVLYGTVPELAPRGDTGRAFATFYTAVIGSGALAPVAYGVFADHAGQAAGMLAAGLTALATIPSVLALRGRIGG